MMFIPSFSFRNLSAGTRSIVPTTGDDLTHYSEERVRLALGRIGRRVRQVEVTLRDLNGPRGGIDQECLIRIEVEPAHQIVADARADSPQAAIAEATRRASAALRRRLQRRRSRARRRTALQV